MVQYRYHIRIQIGTHVRQLAGLHGVARLMNLGYGPHEAHTFGSASHFVSAHDNIGPLPRNH